MNYPTCEAFYEQAATNTNLVKNQPVAAANVGNYLVVGERLTMENGFWWTQGLTNGQKIVTADTLPTPAAGKEHYFPIPGSKRPLCSAPLNVGQLFETVQVTVGGDVKPLLDFPAWCTTL